MIAASTQTRTTVDPSSDVPRQGIIWLASYPKSGNTWFRIFLHNLLWPSDEPTSLAGIGFPIASCRDAFDDLAGIDSSDMTHDEIDLLRPRIYEQIVAEAERFPIFMKNHDAYTYLPNGEPMMSRRATVGAIYFIRNPLDVAVSFAYHSGHENFDRTIQGMGKSTNAFSPFNDRLHTQLRQKLLGWSGHVSSWVDQQDIPVHPMPYEDMKAKPLETFTAAVRFAGLEHSEEDIEIALEKSRFESLQEMEREDGFREKAPRCSSFFRKGQVGSWREKLNQKQAERIVADHGELMRRYGYVTEGEHPAI